MLLIALLPVVIATGLRAAWISATGSSVTMQLLPRPLPVAEP